uniref:Uncharacterized protein n=2 Tax=Vibrio TaxID=662 RepID=A0A0H4A3E6_9VIBR|nr:hypothetical protein [Vibrio kanaloae]AKN38300.1 hypothetical protein [Vibrio sp. 1S_269]AKN37380.1 hypothetical protein [Vibrio kanaloae]AKN37808.1 hypothetical protein [Vibrio kanaloae]AKN38874.1 hypothetical protein [Vibrio kanaloae]
MYDCVLFTRKLNEAAGKALQLSGELSIKKKQDLYDILV